MFLSFDIRQCKECGSISNTLWELDEAIGKEADKLYNSIVYMAPRPCDKRRLKDLIYYRGILLNLRMNGKAYPAYTHQQILSKVKTLI